MSKKDQIPVSSGPGFKPLSGAKPGTISTPLFKPVPDHNRGKDSKSK